MGSLSFKKMRTNLDSKLEWHSRRVRTKDIRYSKLNHEVFVVQRFCELLESNTYTGLIADNVFKQTQHKYELEFPNTIIDIKKYKGIDQKSEGACSFVGFINLCLITGNTEILKSDVIKKWKSYWNKFGSNSASDIGETLDNMVKNQILKDNKNIKYIPFRSEGNSENIWNQEYWVEPSKIINYFKIDEIIYYTCPWVYQNGYFIENLIKNKIPCEINSLEHSRTCVGFNDTQLLFADNWGSCNKKNYTYEQKWKDNTNDHFIAGFSTVNKWAIYSHLRDLVYLE